MKITLLNWLTFCVLTFVVAQNKTINGTIKDTTSKNNLAYVNIRIPNTLIGTISNETGDFNLVLGNQYDTLHISHIGFKDTLICTNDLNSQTPIELTPWVHKLDEVSLSPREAIYYIKSAAANFSNNISHQPFETTAYFNERYSTSYEDSVSTDEIEAVFKTYYSDFSNDSTRNQNMAMLFNDLSSQQEVSVPFLNKAGKRVKNELDKVDLDSLQNTIIRKRTRAYN